MKSFDHDVVWERCEQPGYRTVVQAIPHAGGGGEVHAYIEGPRGGRQSLFRSWTAEEARRRLRRERQVLDAIEVAIEVLDGEEEA